MSTIRVGLVQPETVHGDGARDGNLRLAREAIRACAAQGAQLACLPETFPGVWRAPITWTPVEALREYAAETGIHVVGSFPEPLDEDGLRCYVTAVLIGPDGREIGRYRRTTPAQTPWVYRGGPFWDFEWVNAADLPVFDTAFGKVGLLICSEVYAPELTRALALKGAELIVMPGGLIGRDRPLYPTWRTLVWARAIENLAYTATSSNVEPSSGAGLAMLCSPEGVVLERHEAGVHVGTVDLDRVRWLRAQEDRRTDGADLWRAKPGVLRDWRRQAVFDANPELTRGTPDDARRLSGVR